MSSLIVLCILVLGFDHDRANTLRKVTVEASYNIINVCVKDMTYQILTAPKRVLRTNESQATFLK